MREHLTNIVSFKLVRSPIVCIGLPLCITVILILFSNGQQNSLLQTIVANIVRTVITTSRAYIHLEWFEINQLTNHFKGSELSSSTEIEINNGNQYEKCILSDDCPESSFITTNIDRILTQLRLTKQTDNIFKIMPPDFSYPEGQEVFYRDSCNVNRCEIVYNRDAADLIVFQNSDVFIEPTERKREDQIWVAYFLESPIHTFDKRFKRFNRGNHVFNWTASYRSDSDIVTPYSKFVLYDKSMSEIEIETNKYQDRSNNKVMNLIKAKKYYDEFCPEKHKNLIKRKRGKVAWFASNCNAANNRLEYAQELSKYIPVDIYGKCGNLTCDKWNQTGCLDMINTNYKFYLAFENSNCHEYVTEKLFKNACGNNNLDYLVIPIVLGAPKKDYVKLAPPNSFIHVDDFESAKHLADYLNLLDLNDQLYYTYFRWKKLGYFIETKFMCRLCAILHNSFISGRKKSYTNISEWWNRLKSTSSETVVSSCQN